MKPRPIRIGSTPSRAREKTVGGGCVELDGESFYRIVNYGGMPPFLMTVVSESDHWMFVSSTGGLTAGRGDPDHALFPYTTDDKLHDAAATTGGHTILFVEQDGENHLWMPFSPCHDGLYAVQRNLYKNLTGTTLVFEEVNEDLGLILRCCWTPSRAYGFVRRSVLLNNGDTPASVRVLDGIRNLMPAGIDGEFQMRRSTLADAYKRSQLDELSGLGIFALSSVPTDRAEPSEALAATTVWHAGLPEAAILLSERQVDAFRQGRPVQQETDVRGVRGAYYLHGRLAIPARDEAEWCLVADIDQNTADVVDLRELLTGSSAESLREAVMADVRHARDNLWRLVARADGLQATADPLCCRRHFSNVLFNIMRGGVFDLGYTIDSDDLAAYLKTANRPLFQEVEASLAERRGPWTLSGVLDWAAECDDPRLERLCREYLPLTFSRRHGDPSRPWNHFRIRTLAPDGTRNREYEGNWRDIFQNWEALSLSFPDFVESMICKFLNASTLDGYNPFRIMRNGFDWEVLDPDDPWSFIGYWGDHQIVYLTRLLELSRDFHPGRLEAMMTQNIFAYASVPYRIKPYDSLLANPRDTIEFDEAWDRAVKQRMSEIGTDGGFVRNAAGDTHQVTLAEKLLAPILAKLANLVPEGGIWMNTQRPEWNDANNALVGAGLSMVTLFHLRRHLAVCRSLFETCAGTVTMTKEVAEAFHRMAGALDQVAPLLEGPMAAEQRRTCLDALAGAHETLRRQFYANGLAGVRDEVDGRDLAHFCTRALATVDHSLQSARREDGLVHAYNLMQVNPDGGIEIRHLQTMLEGQVAALASGTCSPQQCANLLDALRDSDLYRPDQRSFVLYPDHSLPGFLEKNGLPEVASEIGLLRQLVADGDRSLVVPDQRGQLHFAEGLRNAEVVADVLDSLAAKGCDDAVERDREAVLKLYEDTFQHRSFTGRSGSMYKYEGLGCIYWHMVSKLALAVQDVLLQAIEDDQPKAVIDRLNAHYRTLCEGIGTHKSPDEYGAFPTDAYSHTPAFAGVQQPGMTGQVKEDIIRRLRELGVRIRDGRLSIRPHILDINEVPSVWREWAFVDVHGASHVLKLHPATLAFSLCQVPFVIHRSEFNSLTLHKSDGTDETVEGDTLTPAQTHAIFQRTADITRVDVHAKLNTQP